MSSDYRRDARRRFNTGVGFPVPTKNQVQLGIVGARRPHLAAARAPAARLGFAGRGVLWKIHWVSPVFASTDFNWPGKLSKSPETPTST